MAVVGLRDLAVSLALDPRGRKLSSLEAVEAIAEVLRLDLAPELAAAAKSFDPTIARAACAALSALAVSSRSAAALRELGGAA